MASNFTINATATTSGLSTVSLGLVDLTSLPGGLGDVTGYSSFVIRITSTVYVIDQSGGESVTMWKKETLVSKNGSTMGVNSAAAGNSNLGGLIGDANLAGLAYDISSNVVRCRITPVSIVSLKWVGVHVCEFVGYP